jgi:hypothetical protein
MSDYGTLTDYTTGEDIRPATWEELQQSLTVVETGTFLLDGRSVFVEGGDTDAPDPHPGFTDEQWAKHHTQPWYMDGHHGQMLDEVTEAEQKRGKAEADVEYWAGIRDENIRRLIDAKVPVKAIVSASGLSRERIYQIRDRRR